MRRRLLLSTSLIALAAVVLLGLPLAIVGTALLHQRADMTLERRADAAALRLSRAQARGEDLRGVPIIDLLPRGAAVQAATADGVVTFGRLPTGPVTRETSGDGGPLRVTLIAPASARSDDVGTLWLIVFLAGLGAVVAAGVLALLQARRLAAPLEQLARRVEQVGQAGYDGSPVAAHLPEIDQVQHALNGADRTITRLVGREREFTANASHQMRTPLTALRMRLEELQALAEGPAAVQEAEAAMTQVDRLITTIEHLEVVARSRDDRPAAADVAALVRAHVGAGGWIDAYAGAGRPLTVETAESRPVAIEPESVRQLVDVLLDNALRHGGGAVRLRVGAGQDGWVRLSVEDEGARPADASAIFGRGVGRGTGIGLAVARDLAQRAGGELRLGTGPTSRFEALLPAAEPPPVATPLPNLCLPRGKRSPPRCEGAPMHPHAAVVVANLLNNVNGLPTHALLVHFTIVVAVGGALGGLAYALVPRFRAWLSVPLLFVGAATVILGLITPSSGEQLEARVGHDALLEKHTELGDQMGTIMDVYGVLLIVAMLVVRFRRQPGEQTAVERAGAFPGETLRGFGGQAPLAAALTGLIAVGAVVSGIWIYRTGEAGARSVWHDTPATATQSGDDS